MCNSFAYLNPQFPSPDTFTCFRDHPPKVSTTTPGICNSGFPFFIFSNSKQELHIYLRNKWTISLKIRWNIICTLNCIWANKLWHIILCNQILNFFLEYIGVKFPYSFPTPPMWLLLQKFLLHVQRLILHLSNRHYYYLTEEKI